VNFGEGEVNFWHFSGAGVDGFPIPLLSLYVISLEVWNSVYRFSVQLSESVWRLSFGVPVPLAEIRFAIQGRSDFLSATATATETERKRQTTNAKRTPTTEEKETAFPDPSLRVQ
jgi:hypothetical protein